MSFSSGFLLVLRLLALNKPSSSSSTSSSTSSSFLFLLPPPTLYLYLFVCFSLLFFLSRSLSLSFPFSSSSPSASYASRGMPKPETLNLVYSQSRSLQRSCSSSFLHRVIQEECVARVLGIKPCREMFRSIGRGQKRRERDREIEISLCQLASGYAESIKTCTAHTTQDRRMQREKHRRTCPRASKREDEGIRESDRPVRLTCESQRCLTASMS